MELVVHYDDGELGLNISDDLKALSKDEFRAVMQDIVDKLCGVVYHIEENMGVFGVGRQLGVCDEN